MKNHTSLFSVSSRLLAVIMPLALFSGCDFELPDPPDVPGPEDPGEDPMGEDEGGEDECELLLEECLDDGGMDIPEDACFEVLDECMGGHDGGDTDGDDAGCEEPPDDPCEGDFLWCLEEGEDPAICEELLDQCDPGEPPPGGGCEDAFFECIDAGEDPMICEELLRMCDPGEATALARAWVEAAQEAGLTYNGACATVAVEEGCADVDGCQIYSGTVRDGEPCTAAGRLMSDCARSASCGVDGRCELSADGPPSTGRDGHRCGAVAGDYNTPCADGLACLDGRCVVAADLGSRCDPETPCTANGWCSEGTCIDVLSPGEACSTDNACKSGICVEGECAEEQPPECVGFSW